MSTINPRERYLDILGKDYKFKKEDLINDSYGIMIDIGLKEGVSSIIIDPQGYGNIFSKTGGRMLHPYINEETKIAGYELYKEVSQLKEHFVASSDLNPPSDKKIFFYIKTETSILKHEEIQDNLTSGKSIFSTAFNTMNDYITLVRESFESPLFNLKLDLQINNTSNETNKTMYGVIIKVDENIGLLGSYPNNNQNINDSINIKLSKGLHIIQTIITYGTEFHDERKIKIENNMRAEIIFTPAQQNIETAIDNYFVFNYINEKINL